jgi:hypothetical protein
MDLEFVRYPMLSSRTFDFDTLEGILIFYPAYYDLPVCRLYPPGN